MIFWVWETSLVIFMLEMVDPKSFDFSLCVILNLNSNCVLMDGLLFFFNHK